MGTKSELSPDKQRLLEQRLRGIAKRPERPDKIATRDKAGEAVLSHAQQQIWVIDQMQPGNPAYNVPVAYRIKGRLDVKALEDGFNEIISRHEILRTTFCVEDGEPLQVVHPELRITINIVSADRFPEAERKRRVPEIVSREALKSFDISQLPLIRVDLYRLGEADHVLAFTLHHIVADGWSLGLIWTELNALYRGYVSGTATHLEMLPIQYADYAVWEREETLKGSYREQLAYWQNQLKGPLPVLELPLDKSRPAVQSLFTGSNQFVFLHKRLHKELQAIAVQEGCTFFIVVLAALQVLLHRYSGSEDLIIGTPVASRNRTELENLVGYFINMIALRSDLLGDPTFVEVLRRAKETTLGAFSNQDVAFETIVENLAFKRDPSRNPVFQVMLQVSPGTNARLGDLSVSPYHFNTRFAQMDLSLHLYEESDGYWGRFEYDTDLFHDETIRRLARHFQQLLKEIVRDPRRRISELCFLSEGERSRMLVEWNATSVEYPKDKGLHNLFERQVELSAWETAIEHRGRTITYGELNSRANQLAGYLIEEGIVPGNLVGICVERSIEMVVGILAILKAGAAYVPLDPSFPSEVLGYIVEDADISMLITQESLLGMAVKDAKRAFCIDKDSPKIAGRSAGNPMIKTCSSDLAYVIYTSGSTGKPKGVMIEHGAVLNFLSSMQRKPGLKATDVFLAVTTISFDIAGLELFLPLTSGAKVVLAGRDEALDGNLLLSLIERKHVTAMQATPSTWRIMIEAGWKRAPTLRMFCGGEAYSRELADELLARGSELWNMYGPTETTIWSSVKRISEEKGPVLIGPPIANTQFYVVDKRMQPVPIGVPGELLIGGDGLARGYWNRLELTGERFVDDPFATSRSRVYKTGDLVRFHPSGDIEFLGRLDFQAKIRGFRIELTGIESTLAQHRGIREVVVEVREDRKHDKRLVAYIVPNEKGEVTAAELKRFLKEKLPEYMIPSLFVMMENLPLTPNGKIDRMALPEPDVSEIDSGVGHVAPRDELELALAEIWRKALGVKSLGVNDNFFDMGGHSLLAARLFAEIERKLGYRLPLAILFEAPTIEGISRIIRQKNWKPKWSSLVPIHSRGVKPPLFLVHGAEGNVLLYKNLASYLGEVQPVYGIQSQGLDRTKPVHKTFESMAKFYTNELKSIQPRGPYCLAGYCLGGAIAFEMAQQLSRAGEKIGLLAVFDSYSPHYITMKIPFYLNLIHRLQRLYFQFGNIIVSSSKYRHRYLWEKISLELSRFRVRTVFLFSTLKNKIGSDPGLNFRHMEITRINDRAQAEYMPTLYDGRIVLFKPRAYFAGFNDPEYGWGELATKGVEVIDMPAYPRGMLNEPFVQILAEKLNKEIIKAIGDA
jgi:amino acid adenylation domain-containing protein